MKKCSRLPRGAAARNGSRARALASRLPAATESLLAPRSHWQLSPALRCAPLTAEAAPKAAVSLGAPGAPCCLQRRNLAMRTVASAKTTALAAYL